MLEPIPHSIPNSTPSVSFLISPIGLVHMATRKRRPAPKYFVPRGGATLELFQPYGSGLRGLYQGQDLWVITYHAVTGRGPRDSWQAQGRPDGVFASTDLDRPNPIEFLRAKILDVDAESGLLHVTGLDSEDGLPILDLRPATTPHQRLTRPDESEGQP